MEHGHLRYTDGAHELSPRDEDGNATCCGSERRRDGDDGLRCCNARSWPVDIFLFVCLCLNGLASHSSRFHLIWYYRCNGESLMCRSCRTMARCPCRETSRLHVERRTRSACAPVFAPYSVPFVATSFVFKAFTSLLDLGAK
jgi:hypothetical protein